MRRITLPERANLAARIRELDFGFATINGERYWDERACYTFTLAEIERDLEAPTGELNDMCRLLVDRVVRDDRLLARLAIPEPAWAVVRESWRRGDPALYGRFDLSYDGRGPAKLLEYNADTPTALYEAAVFQWHWLEDVRAAGRLPADADQFNSIHERLVRRFGELAGQGVLYFTGVTAQPEDAGTLAYIRECAEQGGFATAAIDIGDIGLGRDGQYCALDGRPIQRLFKLYPWEWMFREDFARGLATSYTGFLEPPWKAVLSNKGILPLLWEMAPGHPNLLEAYFDDDPRAAALARYVRKPIYAREGANIELVDGGPALRVPGPYGKEGYVRQALAPLLVADGNHAVIGSWVIAEEPAGIGIREDSGPVTRNSSRFVPHAIVG